MKRAWKGKARSKFSFLNVSTRQLLVSVMVLKKNELLLPWFNLLKGFLVHKTGIVWLGLEEILNPRGERNQRNEELKGNTSFLLVKNVSEKMHLWAVSLLVQDEKYLGMKEGIKKLKKRGENLKRKI